MRVDFFAQNIIVEDHWIVRSRPPGQSAGQVPRTVFIVASLPPFSLLGNKKLQNRKSCVQRWHYKISVARIIRKKWWQMKQIDETHANHRPKFDWLPMFRNVSQCLTRLRKFCLTFVTALRSLWNSSFWTSVSERLEIQTLNSKFGFQNFWIKSLRYHRRATWTFGNLIPIWSQNN